MIEYVAGFLFTGPDPNWVALVRKARPAWQAGRLNGIGGKIEPGEAPVTAMVREFREETGALVTGWRQFATLDGDDWRVYFFVQFAPLWRLQDLRGQPDEPIEVHATDAVLAMSARERLNNLSWLIPLACDVDIAEVVVRERRAKSNAA